MKRWVKFVKASLYAVLSLFVLFVLLVVFTNVFGPTSAVPNPNDSAAIRNIEARLLPPRKTPRVAVEQVYGKTIREPSLCKRDFMRGNPHGKYIWEYKPMAGIHLMICYESDRVIEALFEHRDSRYYNIGYPDMIEWLNMDVKTKERLLQEFLDKHSPLPW